MGDDDKYISLFPLLSDEGEKSTPHVLLVQWIVILP